MRLFALKDDNDPQRTVLAVLSCFGPEREYYFDMPEGTDPWTVPLILSSFASRKAWRNVLSYCSTEAKETRFLHAEQPPLRRPRRFLSTKRLPRRSLIGTLTGRFRTLRSNRRQATKPPSQRSSRASATAVFSLRRPTTVAVCAITSAQKV